MARGSPSAVTRVFLDSGVLLEGLLAPWSASRAVLILSRRRVFKIVLAKYVQGEVEDNLIELLASDARLANETINAYSTLLRLLSPELIPLPNKQEVDRHRHLIRHQADCPRAGLRHDGDSRLVSHHEHTTLHKTGRTTHATEDLHTSRVPNQHSSALVSSTFNLCQSMRNAISNQSFSWSPYH
jgi:hypothetical protein